MEKAKSSGYVRAVHSGDCIELHTSLTPSTAPRNRFYLAYVQAPHVGTQQRAEDPFAFEARQFLRKRLISQKVNYKFEYEHTGRPFVTVFLKGENVNLLLLKEGLARLISKRKEFAQSDYNDPYTQAAADAENKALGVHASSEIRLQHVRKLQFSAAMEPKELEKLVKSAVGLEKPPGGIIEHVFNNGTSFNIYLPYFSAMLKVNLAYIFPPLAKKNEEAIALKGRALCEARLLHKTVGLRVEGIDRNGNVSARLLHPAGDIAEELLKQGLAKVYAPQKAEDDSALAPKFDQDYFSKLKSIEVIAKSKRHGLWSKKESEAVGQEFDSDQEEEKLYLAAQADLSKGPPSLNKVSSKRGACFEATVVEVASGDMVGVATVEGQFMQTWRVNIAGIRAPSFARKEVGTGLMEKALEEVKNEDQPWAWEAKEYLREAIVGKTVTLLVEKIRVTKTNLKIVMVSMWVHTKTKGYKNVAAMVLERGLATLQFPKLDEDAVRNFEDLSAASEQAKSKKLGIHSGKSPAMPKINELYGRDNKQRAKDFQRYILGKKKAEGVIDAVMGINRFKLRVVENNARISFACQGVRGILAKDEQVESIDRRGFIFNRKHILQRNVQVDIEQMDTHGNYFGNLTVKQTGADYAEVLLKEGLVYTYSQQKGSYNVEKLKQAESVAKQRGRGIWASELKLVVESELGPVSTAYKMDEAVRRAEVCDMYDATSFHIRYLDAVEELEKIEEFMKNYDWDSEKGVETTIRGTKCAAQFSFDHLWYRAEISGSTKEKGKVEVVFIDYGNKEVVATKDLCKLPAEAFKFRSQAQRALLAAIRPKGLGSEIGTQAGKYFKSLVWARKLWVQTLGMQRGTAQVVIWTKEEDALKYGLSVNAQMLKKGLARCEGGLSGSLEKAFEKVQNEAKIDRAGLWEEDDDEEDDEF